jgi:murein DD-endopeptidase MepM/ murein hydrolase activator NlpD
MIDHAYGIVSLYGHCSKLAVALGGRVRKGQIIAYVGATGLATGPHVHYELRKSGYIVNPVSYLNLDIFTASKIWNKAK